MRWGFRFAVVFKSPAIVPWFPNIRFCFLIMPYASRTTPHRWGLQVLRILDTYVILIKKNRKGCVMQNTQTTPRIYVACLAAYNNGYLHGTWIEANQEAEAIQQEIKDMLSKSPIARAEEWAIHDYEGFCGLRIGEYEDIAKVAEMAALI